MRKQTDKRRGAVRWCLILITLIFGTFTLSSAHAFTVTVKVETPDGTAVSPYRWMVEEDNTNITIPGRVVPNAAGETSIGIDIHNSYAPVVDSGHTTTSTVPITLPDGKPYFITVMPDGLLPDGLPQYAMSATTVADGQAAVTVIVNPMPIPTAQIYLLAFIDHNPISNAKDEREDGLGGVSISLFDFSGGKILTDGFGNELGTTYQEDGFGNPVLVDGAPVILELGDGDLTTMSQDTLDAIAADPTLKDSLNPHNLKLGEALIKNLAPGKYGIRMVPPIQDDFGEPLQWSQTATIEGTQTIDAWVKAKEPKLFVEGFGTGVWHAFFGFVNYTPSDPVNPDPWTVHGQPVTALQGNVLNDTGNPAGTGTISGKVRFNHFDRPPNVQGLHAGVVVDQCFVGLNDAILIAEPELVPFGIPEPPEVNDALKPSAGLYVTQCDGDGNFEFTGIPPGDYQIVTWDSPLDALFGFHSATVTGIANPDGDPLVVGDLLSFRWFGTIEGTVFHDIDADGLQDPGEIGIGDQAINLRFRDGTIYQATSSDTMSGKYALSEIFPWFKWLVLEVDFARFKAVSMTTAIDYGGAIADLNLPLWPSNGNKSLQPQRPTAEDPANEFGDTTFRRETGPVLSQAVATLLSQTNLVDWGKQPYGLDENGGISGVVGYDTTRAEDDPRFSAFEPWQPGIPRVQMNLYLDFVDNTSGLPPSDGIIDDQDGFGDGAGSTITLADVDNHPFNWAPDYQFLDDGVTPNPDWTGTPGLEDVDRNYPGQMLGDFDLGDAVEFGTTDSWDDNKPSGCIQDLPEPHGFPIPECADAYGTWNQVRPGVFDGGYAFGPDIDCDTADCADKADYVVQTVTGSSVGYLMSGNYIVEAVAPPNILVARSEDKNVDFGDIFVPSPLAQPPVCVGDEYTVPAELTLFPGVPANLAGEVLNHCDRKAMNVAQDKNAAVDFFMYTPVPKAARVMGFANNDLGAEFNQASPIYGEKLGVPWIPISWRDWAGNELFRTYADEWGNYNALLPSTYSINVPSPSGVAPNMLTMVLNDPVKPDGTIDDWYNPDFSVTPWTFNYQPGMTTYTDTPMVPVAAFTTAEVGLDTEQVDGGPVIYEVYATAAGPGTGPMLCADDLPGQPTITLTSLGLTEILNPDWDPTTAGTEPRTIIRDYGFGPSNASSTVTLDGVALPVPVGNWTDAEITVSIPLNAETGRLTVKRGDGVTPIAAELGVTLHIIDCATETVIHVPSAAAPTIQAAIDTAPYVADAVGALILVAPGAYNENVIMNKPVRLQGAGTGSTFIDANPIPLEDLDFWHDRIEPPVDQGGLNGQALEDFMLKNPFSENEAPGIIVFGEQFFPDGVIGAFGTLPLANVFNPGFRFGTADDLVNPDGTAKIPLEGVGGPVAGEAIPGQSLIDGFTLSGSKAGGGIYIFTRARGLQVSNNNVTNNQGNYAGGISVGVPDAGFQMYDEDDFRFRTAGFQNTEVAIIYNKVHRNSGFQGAGGIAVSEDSKYYLVKNNLITGNFSRFHGGGIAHIGRSDGGTIQDNNIRFNENFFGAILLRAGDGGGIYMGGDLAGGTGAGFDLTIDGNLIQGNMTGSGSGGGIRIAAFNGLDVRSINDPDLICESSAACPDPWPLFNVSITNNIIVNNIAGLDGGGLSLQDVSRAFIANNTIANNDSTMVGREGFPAGSQSSVPAPAGISTHPYSDVLAFIWGEAHGQPGLPPVTGPGLKVLEYCIQGHPFEDPLNPNPPECFGIQEVDYTNPELANNIVWHNNSYSFNGTATDPSTGALVGSLDLIAGSYWDLGVEDGSAGQELEPQNSILSALAGPDGVSYAGNGNLASDPLFVSDYVNVLEATTVIDEGGNNINIRFTPFPGSPEVDGSDYHITSGSPAINTGALLGDPLVALDFDDGPRPVGGAFDIGADEYLSAGVLDTCPSDLNNDGKVNFGDLALLKANFFTDCTELPAGEECVGDIDGNDSVNFADLAMLKADFFTDCP